MMNLSPHEKTSMDKISKTKQQQQDVLVKKNGGHSADSPESICQKNVLNENEMGKSRCVCLVSVQMYFIYFYLFLIMIYYHLHFDIYIYIHI